MCGDVDVEMELCRCGCLEIWMWRCGCVEMWMLGDVDVEIWSYRCCKVMPLAS